MDFEQMAYALRVADLVPWLIGETPERWISADATTPEEAMFELQRMAEQLFGDDEEEGEDVPLHMAEVSRLMARAGS
jgi:predicted RNase H-like HicB family nuclease